MFLVLLEMSKYFKGVGVMKVSNQSMLWRKLWNFNICSNDLDESISVNLFSYIEQKT